MENYEGLVPTQKAFQSNFSKNNGRLAIPCYLDLDGFHSVRFEISQKNVKKDWPPEEGDLREYYRVR
jgi:hypothetical protein